MRRTGPSLAHWPLVSSDVVSLCVKNSRAEMSRLHCGQVDLKAPETWWFGSKGTTVLVLRKQILFFCSRWFWFWKRGESVSCSAFLLYVLSFCAHTAVSSPRISTWPAAPPQHMALAALAHGNYWANWLGEKQPTEISTARQLGPEKFHRPLVSLWGTGFYRHRGRHLIRSPVSFQVGMNVRKREEGTETWMRKQRERNSSK